MKILILTWRDIKNPRAGGSELYFHELAKRWVKLGNSVEWISGRWKGCEKKENIDGISIMRVGTEMSLYAYVPFVYRSLKEKPDVIVDNENGIPFFTPLFSKEKKILHIHHVHHDVWFMEMKGRGIKDKLIGLFGYFLEAKVMPIIYRKIPIITISKSSAEEIEEKVSKNVIGIVNPGIEFVKHKKIEKSKKPTILFLNRIKRYKGVKVLLDAVIEINKKIKDFNVSIAGSGDDLEEMKIYAKDKNLDNINFLGKISDEQKKELMQKSWVFVNPSSKEGWGIVNIEANYFGTPVVGSDVSGIKDSIIDGKTGLLFKENDSQDLANKIENLLGDKTLRNKLAKQGEKWAKEFDWNKKAREYMDFLNKINRGEK